MLCHEPSLIPVQSCEVMAASISRLIDMPERSEVPLSSLPSQKRASSKASLSRAEAVAELQRLPGAVRGALSEVVARGAAFHHAGGGPPRSLPASPVPALLAVKAGAAWGSIGMVLMQHGTG